MMKYKCTGLRDKQTIKVTCLFSVIRYNTKLIDTIPKTKHISMCDLSMKSENNKLFICMTNYHNKVNTRIQGATEGITINVTLPLSMLDALGGILLKSSGVFLSNHNINPFALSS